MRPVSCAQSDVVVTFDDENYKVSKLATGVASEVKFAFQKVLECVDKVNDVDDSNFQKEYKTFQSEFARYFKFMYQFV